MNKIIVDRRIQLALALFTGLVCILLYLYATAPSKVELPQAEKYEQQANTFQQQSETAESAANVYGERKRIAHQEKVRVQNTLQERKTNYEKARNTAPVISNTDLDARERRLQSDLRRLYPTR